MYPHYTEILTGKDIIIIPDNDSPGKELARTEANELAGKANSVKIISLTDEWPGLPEKGDISDVFQMDKPEDVLIKLEALVTVTKEWEPTQTQEPAERVRKAKAASEFGEDNTKFLWYPYIPIGDYTVMMADGGTGKTILCCGIIASISSGETSAR